MNIHTATEVAYKNGYAAGAEEFASRLKSLAKSNTTLNETDIDSILEEILQNKCSRKQKEPLIGGDYEYNRNT